MTGIVLVIDDKERLGPVVSQAIGDLDARLEVVDKIPAAKQFLIRTRPGVVISSVLLGNNATAGFDFCREMRDHTLFADLPVILVGETLTEETIRAATDSGAHGLVGWPVAPETLRKRLSHFLDSSQVSGGALPSASGSSSVHQPLPTAGGSSSVHQPLPTAGGSSSIHQAIPGVQQPGASSSIHQSVPRGQPGGGSSSVHQAVSAPSQPGASSTVHKAITGSSAGVGQEPTADDKLKKAQMLLASVLHNLKTSNLLEVIEIEDVPGIVLQMTRTVCGDSGPELSEAAPQPAAKAAASQPGASKSSGADVELNLDDVFGLKK